MSLLRAEDLAVQRGGVPVLERISFELGAGEVLVLRGPNGVGKTSLLRVLAGLAPPVAGRVESEGAGYAAHADGIKPPRATTGMPLSQSSFWMSSEAEQ